MLERLHHYQDSPASRSRDELGSCWPSSATSRHPPRHRNDPGQARTQHNPSQPVAQITQSGPVRNPAAAVAIFLGQPRKLTPRTRPDVQIPAAGTPGHAASAWRNI